MALLVRRFDRLAASSELMSRSVRLIAEQQQQAVGCRSTPATPHGAGQLDLSRLMSLGRPTEVFAGADGAAPAFTERQLAEARQAALVGEHQLLHVVKPWLATILGLGSNDVALNPANCCLVDGQEQKWLDDIYRSVPANDRLKCDAFVSHRAFVDAKQRGPPWVAPLAHRRLQLGRPDDRPTRHSDERGGAVNFILEAKKGSLTVTDFGLLCQYTHRIPGRCRAVLFNATHFQLYETVTLVAGNTVPQRLIKGTWATPGTFDLLRSWFVDFPLPPLAVAVAHAERRLHLRFADVGSVFLGAGATGYVFDVITPDGTHAALKVVLRQRDTAVRNEIRCMRATCTAGAPVATVVDDSSVASHLDDRSIVVDVPRDGTTPFAYYLLKEVGTPLTLPLPNDDVGAVFASLASLHALGVCHGDARLPNVVRVGGALVWIDMARNADDGAGVELQCVDVMSMAASVLGVDVLTVCGVSDALARSLGAYDGSAERAADIAAEIVAAAQPAAAVE